MGLRDQLIDNCIDTIQTRAAKKGVRTEEERTAAIREGKIAEIRVTIA